MQQTNLNLSFEEIFQALQQKNHVHVLFPYPQADLEAAIQSFFAFLEAPENIKTHINLNIAPLHRRGDVGYQSRQASDHLYNDNKEFFHYHPALFEHYPDFLLQNPIVNDFVLKAKPIWNLVYQTIQEIFTILEPTFPGLSDNVLKTKEPHLLLRFLKYDWANSGKYLAKPHFDAGSFTLAIAESSPGLRIGSCPDDLALVDQKPNHAIFMLASNFQKIMKTDDLKPGWHDVIQLDETLIGKPFARWAIVAFIEAHGVEAQPRTITHQWYTGKEAY
jgi:hypothetical protein